MKSLLRIVVLMIISMMVASQLSIDLNGASYIVKEGFWHVDIPIKGGASPYIYTYQSYLSSWKQVGNLILIPAAAAEIGGEWVLRLIVTDALRNRLQRTILIKILGGGVYLGDYNYDQIVNLSSTNITPGTSTLIRSPS